MIASSKIVTSTNRWFTCFKPNPQALLRLFCFPYAGGGTMIYRTWPKYLPDTVEVWAFQPPGRGNRLCEAPFTNLEALVEATVPALTPFLDKPFAFFGHSLGALVSFELAHKLRETPGTGPVHLFVSGRRAPQVADTDPIIYNLPEPEFIEELRKLNGTPDEALKDPELMELMIPLLRADFEICESYTYASKPPLECPLTAFGGLQDKGVTREQVEMWRDHTVRSFSVRMMRGDHFFLHSYESILLGALFRELCHIVSGLSRAESFSPH
jgi:medium-chain acyl-[acyl-carrier-protein] hydrolase